MKRVILTAAVMLFAFQFSMAQDEKITVGAHFGIPAAGDATDLTTSNVGFDASFYFANDIIEGLDLGLSSGYTVFFGDEIEGVGELDDFSFIPIAASARYSFNQNFFAVADLGYAVGVSDDTEGGFYYQPKFGYMFGSVEISAFYKVFEDESTLGSLGVGLGYRF
ncbi:hypothetical protein [Psychroflexus aestuariivivens]|uniref:hypothetical protein n=1 Tax=Psychroflexus aestuariivivens TaxID=1795040 RepID=UPI000FDA6C2B|nr:hypothetical protein [Psychroflexus aestuariivivens]